jgi:hypothetical protein
MRREAMGKGKPDREELLDTLEMTYALHAMPGGEISKRYSGTTIPSKVLECCADHPGTRRKGS